VDVATVLTGHLDRHHVDALPLDEGAHDGAGLAPE
jgi:hypothetical protein